MLDLYSRKLVGWAVDDTMPAALVARAFERAAVQRRPGPGPIHHSDRGSQYASDAYRALLAAHSVIPSMSRPANCYDNAHMESFWATLKAEFVAGRTFEDATHLRAELFAYLEIFYNRERLHGALGYQTPRGIRNQPGLISPPTRTPRCPRFQVQISRPSRPRWPRTGAEERGG